MNEKRERGKVRLRRVEYKDTVRRTWRESVRERQREREKDREREREAERERGRERERERGRERERERETEIEREREIGHLGMKILDSEIFDIYASICAYANFLILFFHMADILSLFLS